MLSYVPYVHLLAVIDRLQLRALTETLLTSFLTCLSHSVLISVALTSSQPLISFGVIVTLQMQMTFKYHPTNSGHVVRNVLQSKIPP